MNNSYNECDYLQSLVQDIKNVEIFDDTANSYTPVFRQVVMKLTDMNVATSKIIPVINESLTLADKSLCKTPSRKTIENIVSEKVAVSQIQVGSQLRKKKHTTMYSDETRKFGKTFNSFLLSDDHKNIYMLGLREMSNKSSQTTLDTFKEILSDISDICDSSLENNEISHVYHILCNIRDFMTDRTKTNIAFTDLLVEYRKQVMPEVIDSWDSLSSVQKNACCKINNFFCGLHLLVNFAECASPCLRNFEMMYSNTHKSDSFQTLDDIEHDDGEDIVFSVRGKYSYFFEILFKMFCSRL